MTLVEAFDRVRRELTGTRLMVAGTGPQEQAARARARALDMLGTCDFSGAYTRPEDKNAFMQKLDVFVLPTLAEGTPNSIIEAMAHGPPHYCLRSRRNSRHDDAGDIFFLSRRAIPRLWRTP